MLLDYTSARTFRLGDTATLYLIRMEKSESISVERFFSAVEKNGTYSFDGIYEAKNLSLIENLFNKKSLPEKEFVYVHTINRQPIKEWIALDSKLHYRVATQHATNSIGAKKTQSVKNKQKTNLYDDGGGGGQNCIEWYWTEWDMETGEVLSETYINTTCSDQEGGGGSGGGSGASVSYWNNLTNPCLNNLLNRVMSNINNINATLTNNFFGTGGYFALNYREGNLPDSINGQTGSFTTQADGMISIDITINSSLLSRGVSEESIANTMMHEALHALLLANGSARNSMIQHTEMANTYVTMLADALLSNFPSMQATPHHATALAWGGLVYTAGYQALSPQDQLMYQNIYNSYRQSPNWGTHPTGCQ